MERLPGGDYDADQNEDGSWNIRRVPIFAECEFPLNKGGSFSFTRAWLEQAILTAKRKEAEEAFMGRVHVHHHNDGADTVYDAGYLRPTHVGELQIDGERKAALFADLLCIPSQVYEMIRSRRLPYRSIEAVPQDGFIDSLALMPTKAPFHRLPMLSIGRETPVAPDKNNAGAVMEAPSGSGALVACFSRAHAIAALCKFGEESHMDNLFAKEQVKAEAEAGSDKGEEAPAKKEGGEGGGGWKQHLDALKSAEIPVEEIPAVVAAIKEFASSLEGSATETEADEAPTMPEEGPVEMQAPSETISSNKDAIQAEAKVVLLQGELDRMKAEKAMDEAVKAAVKRLASFGIGADPDATLRAYAKQHGLARFAGFVEAIEQHGQSAPNEPDIDPDMANLPPEVAKFTDPNQLSVAKSAADTYDRLPRSARAEMSRERYVELVVARMEKK